MARSKRKNTKRDASKINANRPMTRQQAKSRLNKKSLESVQNELICESVTQTKKLTKSRLSKKSSEPVKNKLTCESVTRTKKLTNAEKCKLYREKKKLEKLAQQEADIETNSIKKESITKEKPLVLKKERVDDDDRSTTNKKPFVYKGGPVDAVEYEKQFVFLKESVENDDEEDDDQLEYERPPSKFDFDFEIGGQAILDVNDQPTTFNGHPFAMNIDFDEMRNQAILDGDTQSTTKQTLTFKLKFEMMGGLILPDEQPPAEAFQSSNRGVP